MRLLIAPDKFKGSATAAEVAEAIARGARRALPDAEVDLCPMADGGEGTVEALVAATGGEFRTSRVTGPLGEPVDARWGVLGSREGGPLTAVIEMAAASGLWRVPPEQRDPPRTTTLGTGELMAAAVVQGAQRIILGIGGSATSDGGVGMAIGFGAAEFLDDHGRAMVDPVPTGGTLRHIHRVKLHDDRCDAVEIIVACDVTNPLYGPSGAAAVYGPQKGATPRQVELLDDGLRHLASLLPDADPNLPGAGAAGGLGFGLVAFCGARLQRGVELIMDAVSFPERLARADLVITGEGRLDEQSLHGKTCIGVAQAAASCGLPVIALVGSAGPGAEQTRQHGISAYHALVGKDLTEEEAMRRPLELIEQLAERIVGQWRR